MIIPRGSLFLKTKSFMVRSCRCFTLPPSLISIGRVPKGPQHLCQRGFSTLPNAQNNCNREKAEQFFCLFSILRLNIFIFVFYARILLASTQISLHQIFRGFYRINIDTNANSRDNSGPFTIKTFLSNYPCGIGSC
jgi:hypothetical protein